MSICTLIFLYTQYDYEHVFRLNIFLSGVPQNSCSLAEEHVHECYYQSKKSLKPIKLKRLFEFVLKPILIWLICIVVLLRHSGSSNMHTWENANDRFLHLLSCEGHITGSTLKFDRTHQGPVQLVFFSPYIVIFFSPLCFNSLLVLCRATHGTRLLSEADVAQAYGADRKWSQVDTVRKTMRNSSCMITQNAHTSKGRMRTVAFVWPIRLIRVVCVCVCVCMRLE